MSVYSKTIEVSLVQTTVHPAAPKFDLKHVCGCGRKATTKPALGNAKTEEIVPPRLNSLSSSHIVCLADAELESLKAFYETL
jgi:hypothetical protein